VYTVDSALTTVGYPPIAVCRRAAKRVGDSGTDSRKIVMWNRNPRGMASRVFSRPRRVAFRLSKVPQFRAKSASSKFLQTVRKLDARLRMVAQGTDFRDFFRSARS
jgi:hypothetical protein